MWFYNGGIKLDETSGKVIDTQTNMLYVSSWASTQVKISQLVNKMCSQQACNKLTGGGRGGGGGTVLKHKNVPFFQANVTFLSHERCLIVYYKSEIQDLIIDIYILCTSNYARYISGIQLFQLRLSPEQSGKVETSAKGCWESLINSFIY
jgi:hypothetical protein